MITKQVRSDEAHLQSGQQGQVRISKVKAEHSPTYSIAQARTRGKGLSLNSAYKQRWTIPKKSSHSPLTQNSSFLHCLAQTSCAHVRAAQTTGQKTSGHTGRRCRPSGSAQGPDNCSNVRQVDLQILHRFLKDEKNSHLGSTTPSTDLSVHF